MDKLGFSLHKCESKEPKAIACNNKCECIVIEFLELEQYDSKTLEKFIEYSKGSLTPEMASVLCLVKMELMLRRHNEKVNSASNSDNNCNDCS